MLCDRRSYRLGELSVNGHDMRERLRDELLDTDTARHSDRFEAAHDVLGQIDGQRHVTSLETAGRRRLPDRAEPSVPRLGRRVLPSGVGC